MNVKELITKEIQPLKMNDDCQKALDIMYNFDIRHLPVVENSIFLGLVSQTDLLNYDNACCIQDVISYNTQEVSVNAKEHFFEVIELMYDKKLTIIPVVDDKKKYCGYITQERILFAFAKSMSFTEPGSLLVLKIDRKDYSLAEISQIIESEGGAILMTFIRNSIDRKFVFVTVKINMNNLETIKRSFERHEYQIEATFLEEEYVDVLHDRYNELMNYLNV